MINPEVTRVRKPHAMRKKFAMVRNQHNSDKCKTHSGNKCQNFSSGPILDIFRQILRLSWKNFFPQSSKRFLSREIRSESDHFLLYILYNFIVVIFFEMRLFAYAGILAAEARFAKKFSDSNGEFQSGIVFERRYLEK